MDWNQRLAKYTHSHFTAANGFQLAVWQLPTSGVQVVRSRRVLCVHGFLDSGRSFARLANLLPTNWEVLAPDLRGHGKSRPLPPGTSTHYWEHAKDLSVLLEVLQSKGQAIDLVIGHSMGGNVAALVAGGRPELVPQVLFVDMLGGMPESPEEQVQRFGDVLSGLNHKKEFKPAASKEDAIKRLRHMNPNLSEEGAALMVATNCERDEQGNWVFAFDKELRGKTPFRFPQAFWTSLLRAIKGRGWAVRGDKGYVPSAQDAPVVRERLDALGLDDFVTIPNKGHHLHVDAASELSDLLMSLPAPQKDDPQKT